METCRIFHTFSARGFDNLEPLVDSTLRAEHPWVGHVMILLARQP